jgi:hypothetical protein
MNVRVLYATALAASLVSASSAYSAEMSPLEWGIDRPGNDFRNLPLPHEDPNLCRDECAADARCVAWTYGFGGQCHLKSPAPAPQLSKDGVSGVKALK